MEPHCSLGRAIGREFCLCLISTGPMSVADTRLRNEYAGLAQQLRLSVLIVPFRRCHSKGTEDIILGFAS